jgi:hypothetical protein
MNKATCYLLSDAPAKFIFKRSTASVVTRGLNRLFATFHTEVLPFLSLYEMSAVPVGGFSYRYKTEMFYRRYSRPCSGGMRGDFRGGFGVL